jgi:hypothetical protein
MQSQTFYPLREVPTRDGNFGFVDVSKFKERIKARFRRPM